MSKTFSVKDILFTGAMVTEAMRLYRETRTGSELHRKLTALIAPHMEQINKNLGQINDTEYLAYAIEYALNQGSTQ
jgi:hypothetical protein